MRELDFSITGWLASLETDPIASSTFGSLCIDAGGVSVTEVEDTIARTVRSNIYVSAYPMARWLLLNWWRLRWEPRREGKSLDWSDAHSMAAIGDGYAWPALELASDGDFITLRLEMEQTPDAAAIRYLRDVSVHVPGAAFEAAVERFVEQVLARLSALVPEHRALHEIWAELLEERADPALSTLCRWQALAGIDPGAASDEWLAVVRKLSEELGTTAADEVTALLPDLSDGFETIHRTIEEMRASPLRVNLTWVGDHPPAAPGSELPWQKGMRLAAAVRKQLHIDHGPVSDETLSDVLEVKLPLQISPPGQRRALGGGYRNGAADGRTAVLVPSPRPDNQRFYLARLIGGALLAGAGEHLLPITRADTAFQKFERAFAQELLCPWSDLNAFIDEHGSDDDGIAEAAEYFRVSQRLIESTLVNKRKRPRELLE